MRGLGFWRRGRVRCRPAISSATCSAPPLGWQSLALDEGVRPIAWVLAKGSTIAPLIGARTRAQLAESLSALQVTLTSADVARMEQAIHASAVAGTRYDEHQMRVLDSER